jgi:hypothetical protein
MKNGPAWKERGRKFFYARLRDVGAVDYSHQFLWAFCQRPRNFAGAGDESTIFVNGVSDGQHLHGVVRSSVMFCIDASRGQNIGTGYLRCLLLARSRHEAMSALTSAFGGKADSLCSL